MKNIIFILFVGVIFLDKSVDSTPGEADDNSALKGLQDLKDNCECIQHNCGCCQSLGLDSVNIKGDLCVNASYLDHDYGVSITMTFNEITIINETVSARNPPPVCVGEDIADIIKLSLCIRIYDIDVTKSGCHLCLEINGRISKLRIANIHVGCMDLRSQMWKPKWMEELHLKLGDNKKSQNNSNTLNAIPTVIMV